LAGNLSTSTVEAGSFRDPLSSVFRHDGGVFRQFSEAGLERFSMAHGTGLLDELVEEGKLVGFRLVADGEVPLPQPSDDIRAVYQHDKLPLISYPYEWAFETLKDAALFHLDLNLRALEHGVQLTDATAYNVQFIGSKPIFIDHGAFEPYQEGTPWIAHRQFCEQFLNPLLLQVYRNVGFNEWYRGRLEGIATSDLASMLPHRAKLRPAILTHVVLPAYFDRKAARAKPSPKAAKGRQFKLPKSGLVGFLTGLRKFISGLSLPGGHTVWGDYATDNSYSSDEADKKRSNVAEFAATYTPATFLDVGCNSGAYSAVMLQNGAGSGVGLEFDIGAVNAAYVRAKTENLNFVPLYQNLANPSPAQGWDASERATLTDRISADAIVALAVLHHLVIGCNVPMERALGWLIERAPMGIVEFVPIDDPMVQTLLAGRRGFTHPYSEELFNAVLESKARVVKSEIVSQTGRRLVWYDRLDSGTP
jgi:ribosomal protein L11 methylase PrmA